MGYLDSIKAAVNAMFDSDKTASPEVIKQLATIKTELDEADKKISEEQASFNKKLEELTSDYKNLVLHTSFKDNNNKPVDQTGVTSVSFDDMLNEFIAKN